MKNGAAILLAGVCAFAALAQSEELDCVIEPAQSLTVSFAVEGVVDEVLVDRGDLIEEGQVLARLNADVQRASLEVALARADAMARVKGSQAALEFAELTLVRHSELQTRQIVSQVELDEALREQKVAQAGVLDAKEAKRVARLEADRAAAVLEMRTVRSPIKGVVVEKILAPGEWADPPQVLRVAQIDPLHVEVFAPLPMLGRILVGAEARVVPEDPVGGVHEAKVTVVDRVVNAASGTFGVRLELPNPGYALPAGVKCRVRFSDLSSDPAVEPDAAPPTAGVSGSQPQSW
jgi:RND family efflux transporter MFP subunit